MTETADLSAPLADRPPFDGDELEEGMDEGPTEPVAAAMAIAAEMGFSYADFLELALCCVSEIAADLSDGLDAEEIAADPTTVAALERLQIGAQILAEVNFGEDPDEEGAEEAAEEEDFPEVA